MLTFVTESKVYALLSLFGVSYTASIRKKKMYYMVFITKFGTLSRRKNSQLGHFHDSKIPNWIGTGVIPNWVKKNAGDQSIAFVTNYHNQWGESRGYHKTTTTKNGADSC